jgi:hypothetical protein
LSPTPLYPDLENLLRIELNILAQLLPKDRTGDTIFALIRFIRAHNRVPTDSLLFNDVFYRIRTTDEIINPLRVFVTDKEFVKLYIRATVGEEYNVPTLKLLRTAEDVVAEAFPSRCCIKSTHASQHVIFRESGEPLDIGRIRDWFTKSHYDASREANYKTLVPKVIVEPLVFDRSVNIEYKFFCYKGSPRLIQVHFDRHANHTAKLYDTNWQEQDYFLLHPRNPNPHKRPRTLDLMLELAARLSAPFSFVRLDFYADDERDVVGEITNCHAGACGNFEYFGHEQAAAKLIFAS